MERIDAEQLRQLIDAYGAALTLYARQWCNAPEDALQEALIELVRLETPPDRPQAWLYKAVRCRAINIARAESRRAAHHRRACEERAAWFVDDSGNAFDGGELATMLERLPPLEREIVVARIWGELPFDEIADLVDVSTSAAHRRYQKALALLGEMMNQELAQPGQTYEPRTRIQSRQRS